MVEVNFTKVKFLSEEIIKKPIELPIDSVLPTLLSELKKEVNLVLKAPTGAGKTTRVPPAILKEQITDGLILIIEPRRLAARATARRMAKENGQNLGDQYGYQVRFDRRSGPKTRVLAITPGMLIRKLQGDPFLEDVGVILFDEFHERGLDNDLGFAMACLLQETVRPELKLVVMSATLDVEKISAHLSNCPIVESEGRLFPVDIRYQARKTRDRLEDAVEIAVDELLQETDGDILVFLPGKADIRRCEDRLGGRSVNIYPLHGELSPEQQDNALKAGSRRKVVLSTNVAESSVTVEGITGVVDSGFAKVLQFDNGLELNRLELQGISQASADQRAGRAGRLAPGICIRLWSQSEQRSRPKQQEPELLRVELSQTLLILLGLGEQSFEDFPWLDKPRAASLEKALSVLQRLDAVNKKRELTELGRQLLKLPLEPRLGRLLIEGARLGQRERVALGAAILSERSPFQRDRDRPIKSHSRSDWLDQIEGLEDYQESKTRHSDLGTIHKGAARTLFKLQSQYLKNLGRLSKTLMSKAPEMDADEAALRSLLAAFPDRLARRREAKSEKARMVGGRGIRLSKQSRVWDEELFLCLDIDGGRQEAWARMASGVDRSWLNPDMVKKSIDIEFDEESERLSARERLYYEDLVLEESPAPLPKGDALTDAFVELAERRLERVIPEAESDAGRLIARARCLKEWSSDFEGPGLGDRELKELLPWLCKGCRSFAQVRKADWKGMIRGLFTPSQWQQFQSLVPESVTIPTGERKRLRYELGKRPVLAARIQELFGMKETPTVLRGGIAVNLHLLAPNNRPQQITDDLVSFWNNTYPQVRKDLRGRYPRHSWPEDPWTAEAESRPKRRRKR